MDLDGDKSRKCQSVGNAKHVTVLNSLNWENHTLEAKASNTTVYSKKETDLIRLTPSTYSLCI